MIETIRNLFIEETTQQLSSIESLLSNHSSVDINENVVEKVFLAMHSIKGAGPMVGFSTLPQMTAPVEKAYKKIRMGELNISIELIDKTNTIVRIIIDALKSNSDKHLTEGGDKEELINYFKNLSS